MAEDLAFRIKGLDEFRRGLRGSKDLKRALGQAHKDLGDLVIEWAEESAARRPIKTGTEAIGRGSIKSTRKQKSLTVALTDKFGGTFGAEYGSKQYARFEPWVGNRFEVIDPAGGYLIARGVAAHEEELKDAYLDAIEDAMEPAFPD